MTPSPAAPQDRAAVSLVRLVLAAGRRNPGAPAVTAPDGTADYGTLIARSRLLAKEFETRGAGPGGRVAVVMAPGREAVAAALAAMSLGAAYVPLDPGQPVERLRLILANCAPQAVVADPGPGRVLPGALVPADEVGPWLQSRGMLEGVWSGFGANAPTGPSQNAQYVGYERANRPSGGPGKALERPRGVIQHRGLSVDVSATRPGSPIGRFAPETGPNTLLEAEPAVEASHVAYIVHTRGRPERPRRSRWSTGTWSTSSRRSSDALRYRRAIPVPGGRAPRSTCRSGRPGRH